MGHLHILWPDTGKITKLFKNINIGIPFKTTSTIRNHLKPREKTIDTHNQSGVYQLKCKEYPLKYFEQTGRAFKIRYKEHIQAIKTNRTQNTLNIYSTQDTHTAQSTKR
jgi:hypothetical protein